MGGSSSTEGPPPSPPQLLPTPWRDIKWNAGQEMLKKVREYKTHKDTDPMVNLLLAGEMGQGKSSFVNTIDSIFKERVAAGQDILSDSTPANTVVTKKFCIRKPGGRLGVELGFTICDTMGMDEDDGLHLSDLGFVLDGMVPHGFQFSADTRIIPSSPGLISNSTEGKRMHCMAYVLNGKKVDIISEKTKGKFKELHSLASARGIRVVILVTHVDEMCPAVDRNLRNAYQSVAVRKIVNKIHALTGTPLYLIFLVKNYSIEADIDTNVNALSLTALQKMLDYADDILDN